MPRPADAKPDDPKPVDVPADRPVEKPDPVLVLLAQILERLDQLVADQVERLDALAADQSGRLDTIRNIVARPVKERGYRTRRPNEG